jgi:hypothetical protein
MSWDATATVTHEVDGDESTFEVLAVNYTHNCNRMIREAGWPEFWPRESLGSDEVAAKLGMVIDTMSAQRRRFEAMNPENKWGSYESLLAVLHEMRRAALQWPSAKWEFYG